MSGDRIRDVSARRGVPEDQLSRALNSIKARQRGDQPPIGQPVRTVVFGTAPECDVRVDDEYVSKRHCAISELDDGTVVVEDLGSINGTTIRPAGTHWLHGTRVYSRTPIRPGTTVRIGRTDIPWNSRAEGRRT